MKRRIPNIGRTRCNLQHSEVHNNYVRVALISGRCNGRNVKEYKTFSPQVCDVSKGLQYPNSQDIIHGDVKPVSGDSIHGTPGP